MQASRRKSAFRRLSIVAGFGSLLVIAVALPGRNAAGHRANAADPWTAAQIVQPAALVAELQQAHPPRIIYVGVHTLYNGAHVPGAVFQGPGSNSQGIADLKKYAEGLPRDSDVVIYCGCCPLEKCPNIRPAFTTLREMGFTHLRVLILPTSFAADWIEKGYPVEKGS